MMRSKNTQLFAMKDAPPAVVEVASRTYRLRSVFKHDFYAATCLYESTTGGAEASRIVVKFGRMQPFCGIRCDWLGPLVQAHERAIYRALEGVRGVPKWIGCIGSNGYAIEYIEGVPLDHVGSPPPGFFDRLRKLFDEVHSRGLAYCDANKRSNILIGPDGEPFLIDYQISFRLREDLPWPLNSLLRTAVRYMSEKDLYHLYKHKRRLSPAELTPQEEELSRRRGALLLLHRRVAKQYRNVRRWFLRTRYQKGQLVSPTAKLEEHIQPEKATWRKESSP